MKHVVWFAGRAYALHSDGNLRKKRAGKKKVRRIGRGVLKTGLS